MRGSSGGKRGPHKTIIAIVMSPMLGFALALLLMLLTSVLFKNARPRRADRTFKGLHFVSSPRIRSATAATMRRRRWA